MCNVWAFLPASSPNLSTDVSPAISVNTVTKVYITSYSDVAEIADEVYMEVIVGEEDAAAAAAAAVHEQQMDDNEIKTFMPIAWAAAYGKSLSSSLDAVGS